MLRSSSLSGNYQNPRSDSNVSNIYYIPDEVDTDSRIRDNNSDQVTSSHLYDCPAPSADDMKYEIVGDTLKKTPSSDPTSTSAVSNIAYGVHVVQHSTPED